MPGSSPPRDPRKNARTAEEEYVVFLQGIPPQCRWQELKDLVRQTALHIRQAVVYDDCHGHPTGLGQIIVKNEDEAWRTYNRLSTQGWNGQSLTVTLSLASAPTKPIAGPTKSPSMNRVPCVPGFSAPLMGAPMVTSPGSPPCTLAPETPVSPTFSQGSDYGSFYNPMNGPCSPPMLSVPSESLSQPLPYIIPGNGSLPPQPCYFPHFEPQAPLPLPQYQQTAAQVMSTESSRGSFSTQSSNSLASQDSNAPLVSRNIFIQYLSQGTTSQHLRRYLEPAGAVEKCEIQERKPVGGRPRIFATATFQTVQGAKQAIASFDNSLFRGAKIRVRFDRDTGGSGSSGSSTSTKSTASPASPSTPTRSSDSTMAQHAPTRPTQQNGESSNDESKTDSPKNIGSSPSSTKNNGEPLVVNGSCVGLKAGRTNADIVCHEEELSQKTREIRL